LHLWGAPVYWSLGPVAVSTEPQWPLSTLKVKAFDWAQQQSSRLTVKKSDFDFEVSGTESRPQPRPITAVPIYVDRNYCFSSTSSPSVIFDSLIHTLNELGVDFEYQYLKNKIKGVCYPNNVPCSFRIHVFRASDSFLVEFQRRSGDVVAFSKFYSQFLAMNSESKTKQEAAKQGTRAVAIDSSVASAVTLDSSTMQTLVWMSSSECLDVQREGLRTLTSCLASESNCKVLSSASPDFISSILSSPDEEVVRLGSVIAKALSNASTSPETVSSIFSLLSNSWDHNSLMARDIKRQLSQAAAVIVSSQADQLLHHPQYSEYVSCLERYSCSADVNTRTAANTALDELVF